jgi:creatinine amidohydrolase
MDLPSPDVAEAIARSPVAVLPFGSVEQHGPHLPCGTDTMAAELICEELATRLDALLVPFGPYGVTPIHAGHPGTVSLRPETFAALMRDIVSELAGMGVRTVVLVNWHELNTPSLDRVATDLQDELGLIMVVAQACYAAQRIYADAGGELTHGGGIETLAVLARDPELARLERTGAVSRPENAAELDAMRRSREVYGFVTDIGEFGGDGWYGDPGWATGQDAAAFAATVADAVAEQVRFVIDVRTRQAPGHAASGGTDD